MLIIVFLILVILLLIYIFKYKKVEKNITNYYCMSNVIIQEIEIVDKTLDIHFSQEKNETLYWPVSKTNIEKELKEAYKINYGYYYGFLGMDFLSSKRALYQILSHEYKKSYSDIIPLTIDFYDYNHNGNKRKEFEHQINEDDLFILKKEIQKQTGIRIVKGYKNAEKILKTQEYVIIQKFLTNPYTIYDKKDFITRKINLRIYFLVIIHNNNLYTYIYNDGFLYYTPDNFIINDTYKTENLITSGYISRDIYNRNFLTINDLRKTIKDKIWNNFWDKLKNKFNFISKAYKNILLDNNKDRNAFHIFGADIEPQNDLKDLKIYELNKFPDLSAKDERDSILKKNMLINAIKIIKTSNFLKKIENFEKTYN